MRTMKIRLLLPLLVVVLLPVRSVRAQIDARLTQAVAPAVAPLTASGAADGATFTPLSLSIVGEFGGPVQSVAVSSDGNFAYAGMEQTVAVIDLNHTPEPAQLGITRILGGLVIDTAVEAHTVYAVVQSSGLHIIDAANPANPTVVGVYPSPAARGVAVVGNLAYLSGAGLTILDVSQPGHPVAVGVLPIPEYVLGVTVSGHYAYVATQRSLRILDVTNPASPFEVGSVAVEGARATAVMNGFAYVVQIEDGFAVVNVSNPGAPTVVGQVALPGYTYDISVLGQHLFVAGERHLRTFDVTTPSQPTATGIYYTRQEPVSLAVRNNFVYVAARSAGLHIVDATDLLTMREVGRQDTPGQASGIALAGSHAYVADGAQGLRILSLASPTQPQEVGFYDTPGFAENVAVIGTRAYIADGKNPDTWQVSGLRIIDVSNPAHPMELGSIQTPDDANDVFVVGTLVYVAARESGLRIIDAANPASPQEIGFVDTPGDAVAVAVTTQPSGTYALVADTIYGIRIIDVSNPAQPQEISHLPQNLGGEWNSVVLRGNYAYVTESYWQWDGLYVMDISDPSAPEFVGFAPAERALGVMLVGDRAYVGGSQLTVFDLADPVRPIELGAYESPGRVDVQQALAYQAAGNDGVRVVDVQNLSTPVRASNLVNGPVVGVAKTGAYGLITGDASLRVLSLADAQHPQLVGRLATTTPTNRIVVSGNYAYATQRAVLDHNLNAWTGGGLHIVNVSNPLAPAGRGFFATPDGSGLGPVAVAGHYVYAVSIDIFTPGTDFYAIDVANPYAPVQVGRYSVPAGITNMAVKGPYAYLLTESETLRIIGLANPAQLVEVGSLAIPSDATSLAVTDHYVIIGFDSSDGLHIVDVANPAAPRLVGTLAATGGIEAMSVQGNNLYTARFADIAVFDLSNPLRPLASAYRTVPASQERASIVADGDTIYLPQDTNGLLIIKATPLTRSLKLPLIVRSF